ncbi:MAG TPA: IS21 family transposase [Candidatus Methylomirabilis sp.]|nr:IS21 family transposase [Candidatus Methylomirabilis sp.]
MAEEQALPVTDWRGADVLTYDTWTQIRALHRQGHSIRQIARGLDLARNTVREALRSEAVPRYGPRTARASVVDPYRAYLSERAPLVGYNAWRLYLELQTRGYPGKYEVVKRAVRPLRAAVQQATVATVRFETPPGVQWQADWSTARVGLETSLQRVSVFTMVSGYSRRLYAELTEDQTLPTLLACHEHAFDWFEGLPAEILYDNPKTIVLARDAAGTHIDWNPRFWDFARYYGLRPRLCRVYRARTKGKVEATIKYVKRSFLLGETFASLSAANEALWIWLRTVADQRVHGSLHQRPTDRWPADQAALRPRGSHPRYVLPLAWRRQVAVDGLVTVETNRYSVPAQYIGQEVEIVPGSDETLRIYRHGQLLAVHARQAGRERVLVDEAHAHGLATLSGLRAASWRDHPLPDVEVRDLRVYERLESAEVVHA